MINMWELEQTSNSRYAGILMGIGNTVANIPGILAPIVVASITSDVRSTYMRYQNVQWRHQNSENRRTK